MHYPGAFNRASRARQLAVSDDSSTLFHPSGSVVQASGAGAADVWACPAGKAFLLLCYQPGTLSTLPSVHLAEPLFSLQSRP